MKQMYILGGVFVVLFVLIFAAARLPQWFSGSSAVDSINPSQDITMDEANVGEVTQVVLKTNHGDVTLELFTELMPVTAGNFLSLAENGTYDGVKFHRVIDGFMIQGGDPLSKDATKEAQWGTGGPGYSIEDEHVSHPALTNVRGTIAMANAGPNSGGSQFFINLEDNTNLDFDKEPLTSKHPVFGRVVAGMDVVEAIGGTPTGPMDRPIEPVVIERVEIVGGATEGDDTATGTPDTTQQ